MIASPNAGTNVAPLRRKQSTFAVALAGVMLLPAHAVLAQKYNASGFSIAPPPPFTTTPSNNGRFDVGAGFNSGTGKPAKAGNSANLCEAGFKFAAANNGLTRNQINTLMTTPERIKQIRAAIEIMFVISSQTSFILQGHQGLEFIGTPRMGPGAADARVFLAMIETSAGRMTMVCSTTAADIGTATAQFRNIRTTITMPEKPGSAPKNN